MLNLEKSRALFDKARRVIPGGVNSPVRAFHSVGGNPVFFSHGKGSRLFDVDGNEYIDYVGSWGPLILGYSHPQIVAAIQEEAAKATSFGAPSELEILLAEQIVEMVPSVEKVRLVNSGTEATMSAVRLARGFTGRNKIIKFIGCYHGHGDPFLIQAGSGATTLGVPNSPGVTNGTIADTLLAPFNELETVKQLVKQHSGEVATIIVEPVAGNMGVIPPAPGFLQGLRQICTEHNIVLIFDEVMTGFRIAAGGAQQLFDVIPDLTTLGKIIGGGLPVGAYGGRKEIMDQVSPEGQVYQAGTLSGNPLAVRAGLEMLKILENQEIYSDLEKKSKMLEEGFNENLKKSGLPFTMNRVGSMSCLFFTSGKVVDYESALTADTELFGNYFRGMLEEGVYLAPSQFEATFLSAAHSTADIEKTIEASQRILGQLK